jgi:hypothetical protein
MPEIRTYTAFAGGALIASGALDTLLPKLKARFDQSPNDLISVFEDQTGRQVDFDLRGVLHPGNQDAPAPRVGPGRPKLGVSAREITLLPQHWAWLEQQPNGSSAALRRLVDQAMKREPEKQRARLAMDAACRLMSAIAGNLPNYEEATRALYAQDRERFETLIQGWPKDMREYLVRVAYRT